SLDSSLKRSMFSTRRTLEAHSKTQRGRQTLVSRSTSSERPASLNLSAFRSRLSLACGSPSNRQLLVTGALRSKISQCPFFPSPAQVASALISHAFTHCTFGFTSPVRFRSFPRRPHHLRSEWCSHTSGTRNHSERHPTPQPGSRDTYVRRSPD